jgi:hypothetical protein
MYKNIFTVVVSLLFTTIIFAQYHSEIDFEFGFGHSQKEIDTRIDGVFGNLFIQGGYKKFIDKENNSNPYNTRSIFALGYGRNKEKNHRKLTWGTGAGTVFVKENFFFVGSGYVHIAKENHYKIDMCVMKGKGFKDDFSKNNVSLVSISGTKFFGEKLGLGINSRLQYFNVAPKIQVGEHTAKNIEVEMDPYIAWKIRSFIFRCAIDFKWLMEKEKHWDKNIPWGPKLGVIYELDNYR